MVKLTPEQLDQLIEAYFEERLSASDRAKFEKMAETHADVRARVQTQRAVDASLRRLFAPSGRIVNVTQRTEAAVVPAADAAPSGNRLKLWASLAAAAVLALAAFAGYYSLTGGKALPSAPDAPLLTAYRQQIDRGFKPEEVCTGPAEFAGWMNKYFGQSLYPAVPADGVELVGWSYAPVLSSRSGILLARIRTRPVVVVVDFAAREKQQLSTVNLGDLHGFRKQIGSVVLYEITPFETPGILPILSLERRGGSGG